MKIDQQFSDLLAALYQGALEEQPWQEFLALARQYLDAHLVTLVLRSPGETDQAVMLADGGSLSAIKSYNEGQFVLDPFVNLPSGKVLALHDHMSTDALLATDFYRILMQPQGWYDFLGVDIRQENELDVRFRAGRYSGSERFSQGEKALVEALLPHLERSVRLQTRISRSERERAVYAGAVEHLAVATIILDENGEVISQNSAADQMLSHKNGIGIAQGRLHFFGTAIESEFNFLLDQLMTSSGNDSPVAVQALQIPRSGDMSDLGLVVRAVDSRAAVQGTRIPSVAVFVSDPAQATQAPEGIVAQLFGLTPTEASLAMLLASGLTLDEASAELGVSRNTTRTHLRSIFAKTGVSRQTSLVSLVLKSVANLAGDTPL